jgi:hypothetical protein
VIRQAPDGNDTYNRIRKDRDMAADSNDEKNGFFKGLLSDEGVQRSLAGVVVATVVATARRVIFKV